MKKILKNKSVLIQFGVCLLPFIMGLAAYRYMPEQIATHFNAKFQPDGYSSREFALFGIPAFVTAMFVLCIVFLEADPKKQGIDNRLKLIIGWFIPILNVMVQCTVIAYAIDGSFNLFRFLPVIIGVVFILIGNYLPKCRQNYTMGIKLPWTLNSEENWERTHRFAGKIFVFSGICMAASVFFGEYAMMIMFVIVMAGCFLPGIYSYILYRKGV